MRHNTLRRQNVGRCLCSWKTEPKMAAKNNEKRAMQAQTHVYYLFIERERASQLASEEGQPDLRYYCCDYH